MVLGCRGPRRQGRTSSSVYVTPVTAAPCGCTPDCLQPITHRSSRDSCHFPFLRVRKRVARLPIPPSPHCALQLADPPPLASVTNHPTRDHLELFAFKVEEQPPPTSSDAQPPTQESVFLRKQPASHQPSLSLESPQPATRAASARADVAKSEQPSTFLFFPFSFLLAPSLPSLVPFHPSFLCFDSSLCIAVQARPLRRTRLPGVRQPVASHSAKRSLSPNR